MAHISAVGILRIHHSREWASVRVDLRDGIRFFPPAFISRAARRLFDFAAHAAASVNAYIFQSPMNDQRGYLNEAGLFFSIAKWPIQATP